MARVYRYEKVPRFYRLLSRADVKNVLLIMHTDFVILGVFPRT